MAMKLLIPLGKSKLLWSGAKFDLTKFGCGRMLEGWEARAPLGSFWKSCQPTHWHIPGCVKRLYNCAWTAEDKRQSFSTKKHNGALVVKREFEVDSAAVLSLLSLKLFNVSANRWDGSKLHREYKRQIWANVS